MDEPREPRKKILVVDDNRDNLDLVVKILRKSGYETVEALDGEEALEKAQSERPCLILMDLSIPKIDGFEVTRRLRSLDDCMSIPVVALTAHAMKGDREKTVGAGFDGYIAKPIDVREFPVLISEYIRRNGR
jgi:two-component system cell cycle response regulator DivK